jgi:hypothetical protein
VFGMIVNRNSKMYSTAPYFNKNGKKKKEEKA